MCDSDSKNTFHNLDELTFQFFKLYARFESTLKERDYVNGNNNRVEADWDRFVNEYLGKDYRKQLQAVDESIDYILTQPPMKQILDQEGKIRWDEVPNNDQSVQALFGHIRRVRNNLYHGAKFNGSWFDPKRSNDLLRHSLSILEDISSWLEPDV